MNVEELRIYCLEKEEVTESLPFNDTALVFKVNGKIFAIMGLDDPARISLKCDPDKAIELREQYPSVTGAWHMNKQHWNSVLLDETIHDELITEWIDDSYHLIIAKMPKKDRDRLLNKE